MVVEKGYKQTEVGIIPKDWEVKRLGEVCQFENGDRSSNYPAANEFVTYGIPFINAGHVSDGIIKLDRMDYLPNHVFNRLGAGKVLSGDILFCLRGSLGKFGVVRSDFGKGAIASSLVIIRIKLGTTQKYLICYLKSEICKRMIELYSGGAAQPNLGAKELEKFIIILPPLPEQTAIANALSDMDTLISQTEKLIEKKKAIKQGAMQELLKPKEGWVTKKLGEVANFFKGIGLSKSDLTEDGRFKCIHYGELFTSYKEQIVNIKNRTNKNIGAFLSKANDVLMPTSDVTPNGLATASCISENEVILGGDILIIRCDHNIVDGVFLSYAISYNRKQIMQLVSGSTVYHLYGSDMSRFVFSFPDIETQKSTSQLLTEMENEINKFQTKLQKLKNQKQGMMQALLTGKIRLL